MPRLTEIDLPTAGAVAAKLTVLPFTDSTSSVLIAGESDAAAWPDLSVVVTDDQRAGRGRLDRTWSTPAGGGLAISVLVRDAGALGPALTWLPLAAGTAVRTAVEQQLADIDVALKWPNDVLVAGKKICGVLVQGSGMSAIVGIGINTAMTEFPVETATSFAACGVECDIDALLASIIAGLQAFVSELRAERTDNVREAVSRSLGTLGASVRAILPSGEELVGIATGLSPEGALVLDTADGERVLTAADIVHVRPA